MEANRPLHCEQILYSARGRFVGCNIIAKNVIRIHVLTGESLVKWEESMPKKEEAECAGNETDARGAG